MERDEIIVETQKKFFTREQTVLLKGAAISLVLIGHFIGSLFAFPQLPFGAVGVYLFLILSGFGLVRSAENGGLHHYWKKRFQKVYVPYLLILSFCLVFSLIFHRPAGPDFIQYLFFVKIPFGEYWYLRIQIEWYIAFFVIWLSKTRFRWGTKQFLLLTAIADVMIVTANAADRKYVWTLGAFILGGSMAICGTQWIDRLRRPWMEIGLLLISMSALALKQLPYVSRHELGVIDTLLQLVVIVPAAVFLLSFSDWIFLRSAALKRWMKKVGEYSFELYLTHSVFLELLRRAVGARQKITASILFAACTLTVSFALKYLSSRVTKLP